MGDFASGRKALGVCDVCGFTYKLRELRALVVKRVTTSTKACPECWDEDHPQNNIGEVRVRDPQALRDPRPDSGQYAQSRATILPVKMKTIHTSLGTVTVLTP